VDSTVYYYHTDHLGSVIAVSGNGGSIDTTYSYDAFGKATVQGPDVSRYKYSDKEMFEDLYYFGARFYDPDVCFVLVGCGPSANRFLQIGRFLTLDDYPLSLENLSPATFNHYSFARQ